MEPDLFILGLSGLNTVLTAGLWYRLGQIDGRQDGHGNGMSELARRVGRLEERSQ